MHEETELTHPLGDSSILRFILETDVTLDKIEKVLRGAKFKLAKNENDELVLIEEKGTPIMNEEGITFIMSQLRSVASKDVFVSNFNENETYNNMRTILLNILKELWIHYEIGDWGIRSLSDVTLIYNMVFVFVFASFKRPYMQGERNFMKPTFRERIIQVADKKKGWLGIGGGDE